MKPDAERHKNTNKEMSMSKANHHAAAAARGF